MKNKIDKTINIHINNILNDLIEKKSDNLITIIKIDANKSLSKITIYVSILKNQENVLNMLNSLKMKIKNNFFLKKKIYKIKDIEFKLANSFYEINL